MKTYFNIAALILVLGCSSGVHQESAQERSPDANVESRDSLDELTTSWRDFIDSAKQRVDAAQATYASDARRKLELTFIEDDLKKTDSLTLPIEGQCILEVHEFHGRLLDFCKLRLTFAPEGGDWTLVRCEYKIVSTTNGQNKPLVGREYAIERNADTYRYLSTLFDMPVEPSPDVKLID